MLCMDGRVVSWERLECSLLITQLARAYYQPSLCFGPSGSGVSVFMDPNREKNSGRENRDVTVGIRALVGS
jgi:hypothetical protein